jgi:hypothetical protein
MIFDLLGTPHFHALCLILMSAAAIEALIAIWAATSRVFWLWRALAVWVGIVVLLPIRAYQPALVFAITSPLTIALITLIQSRRSTAGITPTSSDTQRKFLRFGLRDLLVLTAVVGLVLATLLQIRPRLGDVHFAEYAILAAAQTLTPTLSWLLLTTKRRRLCGVALVAAVVAIVAAAHHYRRSINYDWSLIGCLFEDNYQYTQIRATTIAASELALLVFVLAPMVGAGSQAGAGGSAGSARGRRALRLVVIGSWAACLCLLYWQMLLRLPLPPLFPEETNHHRRLMEIIQRMRAIERAGFPKADEPERQALIAETTDLVVAANYVPYHPATDWTFDRWNTGLIGPAQYARTLARTIDAECAAAHQRGETERAGTLALTNVRLGLMLQRGGTVVESLIGNAVQGIANERLAAMRGDLSSDQARRVIDQWNKALLEQEDIDSIFYRDQALMEYAYGWAGRLGSILHRSGIPERYSSDLRETRLRLEATVRLLQTELAIHLYREDHGELPERLDRLVPDYLPGLPLDPYTRQPLVYRKTGDAWVIYSVGHDGVDDGGNFTNMKTYYSRNFFGNRVRGHDFDLDAQSRP